MKVQSRRLGTSSLPPFEYFREHYGDSIPFAGPVNSRFCVRVFFLGNYIHNFPDSFRVIIYY